MLKPLLLAVALAASIPIALAQNTPAREEPSDPPDTEDTQKAEEKAEVETPDSFEASEQVSDDVSVAFPVDI